MLPKKKKNKHLYNKKINKSRAYATGLSCYHGAIPLTRYNIHSMGNAGPSLANETLRDGAKNVTRIFSLDFLPL